MTILATHNHNGTLGATATAAAEGYDAASGTAIYVAGGIDGTSIRYDTGTEFHRDDITAEFVLMDVTPVAVTGNTTILRFCTAADASIASVRITATGAIAALSALSTQVDITAAGIAVAGTTIYIAARAGGSTQEIRIYDAAGELLDTLTGAAAAGTVGRYYVGHGHAGASTDGTDVGKVVLSDAWESPIPPIVYPRLRGVVIAGAEVDAIVRGVIAGGVELGATVREVVGNTPPEFP